MKRYYCNGKNGYYNRGNDGNIDCKNCEFANGIGGKIVDTPDTNYERIRNMSVEEMASKIVENIDCKMCPIKNTCETWQSCEHEIIKWLESEVTEE